MFKKIAYYLLLENFPVYVWNVERTHQIHTLVGRHMDGLQEKFRISIICRSFEVYH